MNLLHRWICSSAHWQRAVERDLLPWTLEDLNLGENVLELGPGFGAVTDIIRPRVAHLTCVEIDPHLAERLRQRTQYQNVTVLREDATQTSLPAGTFDSAVSFTMLHHLPSTERQDRLLAETFRTLRPGGVFAGTDNRDGQSLRFRIFRLIHLSDTLVLINPSTFTRRLAAAGFQDIEIALRPTTFRFRAWKPLNPYVNPRSHLPVTSPW